MLFGALLRATNRAFWCSPSCHKSCFLVLSLVPKSCSRFRSCFFVLSFVPKLCSRSCSLLQLLGLCQYILDMIYNMNCHLSGFVASEYQRRNRGATTQAAIGSVNFNSILEKVSYRIGPSEIGNI